MVPRILVADDSKAIQKAIQIALAPYAVEIVAASSYPDALQVCQKIRPELVIADAALKDASSPHDLEEMIQAAGHAGFVWLEGSFEPIDRDAFAAKGPSAILKKPFDSQELIKAVTQQLKSPLERAGAEILVSRHLQQEAWDFKDLDQAGITAPARSAASAKSPTANLPRITKEELLAEIKPFLQGEIALQVSAAVAQYCNENFKELAREVIGEELRKLVEEKTRYLNEP